MAFPQHNSLKKESLENWMELDLKNCFFIAGFPLSPKTIRAEQVNMTSVNISWVSGFDAYSKIIRHRIRYRFGNESTWNYMTVKSEWKVFEVPFGTVAFFSVASENSVGVGGFSDTLEVIATLKGIVS